MESPLEKTINTKDSQGFNCLYYAVYHGHLPIVKLLKRSNVNYERDAKGTTCLHIAIMRGHASIVEFLLMKTPEVAQSGNAHARSNNANNNDKDFEQRQIKLINRTNKDR